MERRALQLVLALLSLIPLIGVAIGFTQGAAFFGLDPGSLPRPLDNQFRYLSGVYVMVSAAVWVAIPAIESRALPIRLVALGVFVGGVGRCISMATLGLPEDPAMIGGVAFEMGVVPLLVLWQRRIARLADRGGPRQMS